MKGNTLRIVLILLVFSSQIFAQQNNRALKFDEFDDSQEVFYTVEEISLQERIKRFITQINKERGKKIYIIYYRARKTDYISQHKISNWAERTKTEIIAGTKSTYDDVLTVDGGYREKNTLEYWIVPKTGEPPTPAPTFTKAETFDCPNIYLQAEGFLFDKDSPVQFSASVYPKTDVRYEWKISDGKIVEGGQGADFIKVDLTGSETTRVTAFVDVSGLPFPCEKTALATVELGRKAYRFDSAVRYNESDLFARLDAFMVQLGNNPMMAGYIIVYASRSKGVRDTQRAVASVRRFFAFRRYDISRVTIIEGGFREYSTVDTWLVPPGAAPPVPTPSADSRFFNALKTIKPRKKS
ncbi:MAG TPA: hypothetical protein VGC97_02660 [Pyrinomonadaceae bacterium]|jgi:hypothetical protein